MTLEAFLQSYGYLALLAGACVEGEATLLIAGFMAHAGHFHLHWVILVGALGAFSGDQALYRIARFAGTTIVERRPHLQTHMAPVRTIMERYQTPLMAGFRFVYGIRLVTVLLIGINRLNAAKFAILDAIGVFAWATVFGCAGYLFGHVMERVNLEAYDLFVVVVVALLGLAFWLLHHAHLLRRHNGARIQHVAQAPDESAAK